MSQLKSPGEAIKDNRMFRLSWFVLTILLIGYFGGELLDIPVSIVAGVIAIFFLMMARKSPIVPTSDVIKGAPWAIVFFSVGMYVVVYGLQNVGLTALLAKVYEQHANRHDRCTGDCGDEYVGIDAGSARVRQCHRIGPRPENYTDRVASDIVMASRSFDERSEDYMGLLF